MNTTQQRMTAIFNEWAKRYAANPEQFSSILDADGNPVTNYGECCTHYFEQIADEMGAEGLLPLPQIALAQSNEPPNALAQGPGGSSPGPAGAMGCAANGTTEKDE